MALMKSGDTPVGRARLDDGPSRQGASISSEARSPIWGFSLMVIPHWGSEATFWSGFRVEEGVSMPKVLSTAVASDSGAEAGRVEALPEYAVTFEAWVRTRSGSLRRPAYLLTGDEQLAQDLVQTALTKVAKRWPEIVAGGDPTPYVRQVLTRTAIGWRRRRWRGEVPHATVPEVAGVDLIGSVPGREVLRAALMSLPARQRAVVVFRFYEDLSEAQTAALLGCSVGTVKSQSAKALAKLRRALGAISEEDDNG